MTTKISQIQVGEVTYSICDAELRESIAELEKHQWNIYETDAYSDYITIDNVPARTMTKSDGTHPYTLYKYYTISEQRNYIVENAYSDTLLCNSVQFLATMSSAANISSAVFDLEYSPDTDRYPITESTIPSYYQIQYCPFTGPYRDQWLHFKKLYHGSEHQSYRSVYGAISSSALTSLSARIRGWVLTKGLVTVDPHGWFWVNTFLGEEAIRGSKTITITG